MIRISEKVADRVSAVWLEEYKILSTDIIQRVGLQHQILGLNLVFLSSVAGYLFKYGLDNGFSQIINSEVLILSAIAPFLSQIFTWRHIDHDSNIIDKANYIETVISPNLNHLLKQDGLLGFESYLAKTRVKRIKSVGIFAWLGNDHVISIFYALIYLVFGWFIICSHTSYAGRLKNVFPFIIVMDTVLMLITIYMALRNSLRYRHIGRN